MYFKSKTVSLLTLGITAVVASRALFLFFNDPEGPNLLVVLAMAAVVYLLSLAAYVYYPSTKLTGLPRLLLGVLVQVVIVTVFYLFLN